MNLIDLLDVSIEGYDPADLFRILTHQDESIHVTSSRNGSIILSNRKIIKCVENYYRHPTIKPVKAKSVNTCHAVHKNLNITTVASNSCESCHIACMAKKKDNELFTAIKSSSKRRK